MAIFRSPLIFDDENGLPYTLVVDLAYESDVLGRRVTVPAGFKTDLASIPRGLWNILPKSGRYDRAAVVHDFLYATNGVTRKQADQVLSEAMTYLKVPAWQRRLIYAGVRVGGWKPWNAYRRQQTANHP
jgi:hypothetical protein